MTQYYFEIVALQNCPYSIAGIELLKDNKIKNTLISVNQENKDKYKTEEIQTFPQIYLKKENRDGSVLIGGYNDIKEFVDNFKNQHYDENKINIFLNKHKNLNRKNILRIIELFN
jgi:glutaredoxin